MYVDFIFWGVIPDLGGIFCHPNGCLDLVIKAKSRNQERLNIAHHRRCKIRSPVKAGSLSSTNKAQPKPVVKILPRVFLIVFHCICATLESGVQRYVKDSLIISFTVSLHCKSTVRLHSLFRLHVKWK